MDPQPRDSQPETKKGYVQYNAGTCKFGGACRYKHECSGCGGSHLSSRCFKQEKGCSGETGHKREDPSDGGKDAAVSR